MRRCRPSAPMARLLIVGLAPGLKGANRTGRPFTGDYAGDLLYATLLKFGFARGVYDGARPMTGSRSSTAASPTRCAACRPRTSPSRRDQPRAGRFSPPKSRLCRIFASSSRLGAIAHQAVLATLGRAARRLPLRPWRAAPVCRLACCSPTAITARATTPIPASSPRAMFEAVFAHVRGALGGGLGRDTAPG